MTPTLAQAEAYIEALETGNHNMSRKIRKLRHEIRVLHLRLADANRGAARNAEANYELFRQAKELRQAINALRAENEYLRERLKEERP